MIPGNRKSAALSYALLAETTTMLADFIAQGSAVAPINVVQTINSLPAGMLELLAVFMLRHARETFVPSRFSTLGEYLFVVANARAHLADPASPRRGRDARPALLTEVERLGLYPGA